MQERNQDITVLVIAPIAKPAAQSTDRRYVNVVARTTLRNPVDGAILPRPERAALFTTLQQDLARVFDDSKVPPVDPRYEAHAGARDRSEEHTSELQSLMRISYAVFCLKKKT